EDRTEAEAQGAGGEGALLLRDAHPRGAGVPGSRRHPSGRSAHPIALCLVDGARALGAHRQRPVHRDGARGALGRGTGEHLQPHPHRGRAGEGVSSVVMAEETAAPRVRARALDLPLGRFRTGRFNAITDVSGVLVGHTTLIEGEGPLRPGKGPVRTGVTAIVPSGGNIFMERLHGGGFVLNGAGEVSGLTQVMEWGLLETPILLTNTLSVGTCSAPDGEYMVAAYPSL